MADLDRLRAKIDDAGIKKQKIAEMLGITRQALSNKLSGRSDFRLRELDPLCNVLQLTAAERTEIFFWTG